MSDYGKLTDRELDAAVAEKVMGLKVHWFDQQLHISYDTEVCKNAYTLIAEAYSDDDNAARLVRDRIAELGIIEQFSRRVRDALMSFHDDPAAIGFDMMQATPRQQCIAALMALEAK